MTHTGPTGAFWNAVLENWQSEFLQLLWQVGGMMLLLAVGSSQSRNESERMEAKIDQILVDLNIIRGMHPEHVESFIEAIDLLYDRK